MSELAKRLIAQNRKTKDTFLDLGNCGLRAVPEEIGGLKWLEALSLASYGSQPHGKGWRVARSLNAGPGNDGLVDITALRRLARLCHLDLEGTKVSDLQPLAGLSRLRRLFLTVTPVA